MLFTDIEGSTRLLKQLGERYGELLADHRRLLRAAFAAHGGREIDTQGDAFFVAFARARDAVEAAIEGQRALAAHEWPDGVECRVRMGLHTASLRCGEEGYHGIGLHRGARIVSAAHGGQVLLSSATAELIQDDLPAGVTLRDLGGQQLKDIDRPEHLYQLVADGLPAVPAGADGAARAGAARCARGRSGERSRARRRRGGDHRYSRRLGLGYRLRRADLGRLGRHLRLRRTAALTGQIPVGASPSAVAAGAGSIWVANVDAHSVSRVDPVKQVMIQTIPVGNGPDGIACGGGFVWVANGLDGTVTKIDPQTNTRRRHDRRSETARPGWRSARATSGSRTRTTAR